MAKLNNIIHALKPNFFHSGFTFRATMKLSSKASLVVIFAIGKLDAALAQELGRQTPHRRILTGPTRWDACVEQNMTAAECEEYILSTVGGDLSTHQIPNLEIKLIHQRSSEVLSASYWMFGVPTNIFGETDCNLNGGASVFPWEWEASDGSNYTIPKVPCSGLGALECCDAVTKMMIDERIPLTNVNGDCFSCWVHQEPLRPKLDKLTGEIVYVEHSYDTNAKACVESTYSQAEVQANDAFEAAVLIDLRVAIKSLLASPEGLVTCGDISGIRRDVLLHGRSFPRAMSFASGLICGQCSMGNDGEMISLSIKQHEALQFIQSELSNPIQSDKNCIAIYTDTTGKKVLKVPQIGGSRNDTPLEFDDRNGPDGSVGFCLPPLQDNGEGGCMCPAVQDISDNKVFWLGAPNIQDTSEIGFCECPPSLVEYNNMCFCQGGFKIWDPASLTCVCPHGLDDDGSCLCPGPFSGLDWNNVGWVKNQEGDSCKVDSSCTLSDYQYYSNFEDGCDSCRWGYVDDGNGRCILDCGKGYVWNSNEGDCVCDERHGYLYDYLYKDCVCADYYFCEPGCLRPHVEDDEGNCVLECDTFKGFVYDSKRDICVCEFEDQVVVNGRCECGVFGAVIPQGETECQCVEPAKYLQYDPRGQYYYCSIDQKAYYDDYEYNYGY